MHNLLITFLTILFCITSSVSWSKDFQKGITAYKNGDFKTALLELEPLASKGDMLSQTLVGIFK